MFIRPFRLVFNGPDETGASVKREDEKKPTSEMTPEERIAFEEGAKRKAQDKLKAFGGKTPDDVAKLEQELEALRKEKLTEQERAIEDARAQALSEAGAASAAQTVDAVLKVALRGRTADAAAVLGLDRASFITDGVADTDAIEKWVEENSAASGEKRPPVRIGQGDHEHLKVSDRATGEAEAEKRFGKKN